MAKYTERMISLKEVEEHYTYEDCWIAIENEVYNLTPYLPKHPGGAFIMGSAGSDATVVFNCYHYHKRNVVDSIKKPLKIGNLIEESPKMGPFWLEAAERVTKEMKGVPRKPWRAVFLWLLDSFIYWATMLFAWFYTDDKTPLWTCVVIFTIMKIWVQRFAGHCHMIGHMAYFGINASQWAMKFMGFSCAFTAVVYALPNSKMNMRRMLNKHREEAQYEYAGFTYRGPMEHQAIHHVKGTMIKDDACYRMIVQSSWMRIRHDEPYKWYHAYQHWFGFVESKFVFLDIFRIVQPVLVHYTRMTITYLRNGLWYRAIDLVLGVCITLPMVVYAQWLPIINYGWRGFLCQVIVHVLCIQSNCDMTIFLAQHVWDSNETEESQHEDWGKANCETSITLSGMEFHPACWGMGSANPSTLTNHLEHTMFPGMCYLNLHKITDILEETAKKHKVKFNKFVGPKPFNDWVRSLKLKYGVNWFKNKKLA